MKELVFKLVVLFYCFLYIASSSKILMIIENNNIKNTHSQFIKMVRDLGNVELTIKDSKDRGLELFEYGEAIYDNLILLAPSLDLSSSKLDVDSILQFLDIGRNVFFVADENLSKDLREVASECGVVFAESGNRVIDHFNRFNHSDNTHNTLFSSSNLSPLSTFFSPSTLSNPSILFDGISHVSESKNQRLNLDLLVGNPTTYSYSVGKDITEGSKVAGTGREVVLVSALQARNNARAVFLGSTALLSDNLFQRKDATTNKPFSNSLFVNDLLHWTFQLKSVLRFSQLNHHRDGETQPPSTYVINEFLSYSVLIEELVNGKWVPFVSNEVQLEWTMLDPHIRTNLNNDGKGLFSVKFKIPDVYGIFTLKLEFENPGYTFITQKTMVPVRPLRHNEYERFIVSAYPYYAGSLSMLFGAVFLSIIFLFSDSRN